VRLATAIAAHADRALDEFFPLVGPCGLCGVPGLPQRHRVVDAIAGRLAAGEDPGVVAEDYGLPFAAVEAVSGVGGEVGGGVAVSTSGVRGAGATTVPRPARKKVS
jgi:hypothetical protein